MDPLVPPPPAIPASAVIPPPIMTGAEDARAAQARFFPSVAQSIAASAAVSVASPSAFPAPASPAARELQVVWQGHWRDAHSGDGARAMETDETEPEPGAEGGSRMVSREYKLTASSLSDLTDQIHRHFPTTRAQPIQLTDEEQRPLTQAAFNALHSGDVVLVFEAGPGEETSIVWQWSKSFQHIPHPSIVTYSQELIAEEGRGASHAVVYALAEFIDNSISALRKYNAAYDPSHTGHIRVFFLEHAGRDQFSIVIEDDGCGMTRETLEAFSRMGDAPQYRGEAREAVEPDADNHYLNINISQWGIGAKSAGFFIGDNIIVSSRAPHLKQVLECAMSQKRMFAMHRKIGNAFQDEMSRRAVGDTAGYPHKQVHPYLRHLIQAERNAAHSHFTRICVTGVEERHLSKFSQVGSIASELANIYNRFLHGPLGRDTADVSNDGKVWLRPNITVSHVVEVASHHGGESTFDVKHEIDLRSLDQNDASQFQLLRRGPVFRFEMLVNAPVTDTHSTEMVSRSSQARVRGEIYYLPRSVDGETHPDLRRKKEKEHAEQKDDDQHVVLRQAAKGTGGRAAMVQLGPTAAAAAASRSSAAAGSAAAVALSTKEKLDADGNIITDDELTNTFDVYWHGRLIPLSHVHKLSFMKFTPENKDCLPRMKGYLFFSFPFLTSRNKLTFAERNLQDFLNNKENQDRDNFLAPVDDRGVLQRPNRNVNRWGEALKAWKALDANYEWSQRYYLKAESQREGKEFYSQVSIHGASSVDFQVLKSGRRYKIRSSSKKAEWLEAMWFEKESAPTSGATDDVLSEYGGSGKIWGELMPKEAQQGVRVKSLRMIDKDTPLLQQKHEYAQHRSLSLSNEPHHIVVWMEPRERLRDGTVFNKSAGWSFPGTAVAVFGHLHNAAHKVLGSGERAMCEIRHFTKDFPPEGQVTQDDQKESATSRPKRLTSKPKRLANDTASSATDTAGPARPSKRAKHSSRTDLDAASSASAAARHTTRPKPVRRSSGDVDEEVIDLDDDSDSDHSDEEEDDDDEMEGETVPFRDTAPCMMREVAEAVHEGGREVSIHNDSTGATAIAVAAAPSRKRKNASPDGDIGRNGFLPYHFMNHSALGRYLITFDLPNWRINGNLHVSRKAVPKVKCEIILTPALPVSIAMSTPRVAAAAAATTIDLSLGRAHDADTIGFRLSDAFKNEWTYNNLRGQVQTCGVRVRSITTKPANLVVTHDSTLVWSRQHHHWSLRNLQVSLPPNHPKLAGLVTTEDRIDLKFEVEFEWNAPSDGVAGYRFDPPPKPEWISRLRSEKVTFNARLGAGGPTHFICDGIPNGVTVENGGIIKDLSMYLTDLWEHRTAGSGMRMITQAALHFIPATLFTADHDVLTRTGWRPIHQVRVGDAVWSLHDPAAGDVRQEWTTVTSVDTAPAPNELFELETPHYKLLTRDLRQVDATFSTPIPRGAHSHLYGLVTANHNFYIRRRAAHRWSPIFTGAFNGTTLPFPLPSMSTTRHYEVDSLGQVIFDAIPIQLDPAVFASHCVELIEGEPIVEFNIRVQLEFIGRDELHPVKTSKVTVRPRWGPVRVMLMQGAAHLADMHAKVPPSLLESIMIRGEANDDVTDLHVAFLHESGRLIPVSELQDGLFARQQHLHFYLDGLDGARNHFTLADLNRDGHIEAGLNLPAVIDTMTGTPGAAGAAAASLDEGQPRFLTGALRMVIEEPSPVASAATPPAASDASAAQADAAMTDVSSPPAAPDNKAPLSSLLPFSSLHTPFSIRLSPGAPSRWSITASFPRGLKCGLMWGSHMQIALVDQFGNRTAMPKEIGDVQPVVQVYSAPPTAATLMRDATSEETTPPAATSTSAAMDVDAVPDAVPAPIQLAAEVTNATASSSEAVVSAPASTSPVPVPAVSPSPPIVGVAADAPLSGVLRSYHPSRESTDGSMMGHFTASQTFLVCRTGAYWLVVIDPTNRFAASTPLQVQVIAGLPHLIRAFTSAECTDEDEVGYSSTDPAAAERARGLHTSSKGRIGRLWCKFYDRGDNETTSTQTVELQLVLPKEAAPMPTATTAAAADGTTTTKVELGVTVDDAAAAAAEDTTVSGIYAYPLSRTKPSHESIFSPNGAPADADAAAAANPLKTEFTPLSNVTGAVKTQAASSFALLEEFTLHLNSRHLAGAKLMIRARDTKQTTNGAAKKKAAKAVRNDIIIPLAVKPFVQAVEAIQIRTIYEQEQMRAAMETEANELTLKPQMITPPAACTTTPAAASSSGRTVVVAPTPVPSGTPFPIVQIGMVMAGISDPFSSSSPAPPTTTTTNSGSPTVKLESDTQDMLDSSVYTSPFMLRGLSIEVFHLPNGMDDPTTRHAVKNIYQPPRFDVESKRFVFDPIRPDLPAIAQAASSTANDDYVFNATGDWLFLVRYLEPRETVANVMLPTECERFAQLTQAVVPGQPKRMDIHPRSDADIVVGNVDRASLAHSAATASFQPRAGRTIASNLTLKLFDRFNQPVQFGALSDESIAALQSIQWSVRGVIERPLPVVNEPTTTTTVTASMPSNTRDSAIIIIDSDDEDEVMGGAPPPAVTPPPPPPATAPYTPPQLHVSPVVLDVAASSLVFSDVSIAPNSAGDSGKYLLRFLLPAPFNSLSAETGFYFSNDHILLDQHLERVRQRRTLIHAAQMRYDAKLKEVLAAQDALAKLDHQMVRLQHRAGQLQEALMKYAESLEMIGVQVPPHRLASVASLHAHLLERQDELRRQLSVDKSHSVPAKIDPPRGVQAAPPRLSKSEGFHGQIAHLASIADSKLCALISWHMQSYLNAYVTSDRSCVADREIRRWCRENRTGQVLDLAGINLQRFDPATLPHHLIRDTSAAAYRPTGHPRYLVSCFDFNTDVPHEQGQYLALFLSLMNRVLILDSMDDAVAYRQHLVRYHQSCPTILVLKECKALASNNIERFDNNAFARGLNHLHAHFEIRPARAAAGRPRHDLQEQAALIAATLAHLPSLEPEQRQIQAETERLNHTPASKEITKDLHQLKQQLRVIEYELVHLGVTPQQVSAGGAVHVADSTITPGDPNVASPAAATSTSILARQSYQNDQERRRAAAAIMLQQQQRDIEAQQQRARAAAAAEQPAAPSSVTSQTSHGARSAPRGIAMRGGRRQ